MLAQALPAAPLHDAAAAGDIAELGAPRRSRAPTCSNSRNSPAAGNGVAGDADPLRRPDREGRGGEMAAGPRRSPRCATELPVPAPAPGPDVLYVAAAFGSARGRRTAAGSRRADQRAPSGRWRRRSQRGCAAAARRAAGGRSPHGRTAAQRAAPTCGSRRTTSGRHCMPPRWRAMPASSNCC